MKDGEEVARCPSCSLIIKVIYSPEQFEDDDKDKKKKKNTETKAAAESAPAAIEAF